MSIQAALERRQQALAPQLAEVVRRAAQRVPGLAARLTEAGVTAEEVCRSAGLGALPVLAKDDLVERQRTDPPHGGLLAPDAAVVRWFQSPGPLYEPQLAGADWRWGQALADLGVGGEDVVLNCFGYHLSPAGAMLEQGAHSVGAAVVPGGIGGQDLQAQAIADLGVTAYTGLPSYLKALVDRYAEAGLDPARWRLERALVTAEPLPDSLRAVLTQRVPHVRMAYGTGETGLLAWEPAGEEPGQGLVLADGVDVQVCAIGTGEPLTDGAEGEVVISLLRADYPLIRFGTGDLSAWRLGPDGSLRLAGVLGRVGQAVKVKGMFLHPRQVTAVMAGAPGVADYRFVIDREDHVDRLTCRVVADGSVPAAELRTALTARVRDGLRFRVDVEVVDDLGEGEGPLVDARDWT